MLLAKYKDLTTKVKTIIKDMHKDVESKGDPYELRSEIDL